MTFLKVSILRYVSEDPQPGILACQFVDANGRHWCFIEKTAVVYDGLERLGLESVFPKMGFLAGTVGKKTIALNGVEVVEFSTAQPYGIESIEGESNFLVTRDSIEER